FNTTISITPCLPLYAIVRLNIFQKIRQEKPIMRSYYCGEVTEKHIGQTISLYGWVHRRRDHGGVIFVDLRDREGVVQIVFDPTLDSQVFKLAERLRNEFVLAITGKVRARPEGLANPNLPTGAVE